MHFIISIKNARVSHTRYCGCSGCDDSLDKWIVLYVSRISPNSCSRRPLAISNEIGYDDTLSIGNGFWVIV